MTEVCHLVGFSSVGTFSARFSELVGVSPSEYQRRYDAPRIPGCWVFMLGVQREPAILKESTYGHSTPSLGS